MNLLREPRIFPVAPLYARRTLVRLRFSGRTRAARYDFFTTSGRRGAVLRCTGRPGVALMAVGMLARNPLVLATLAAG